MKTILIDGKFLIYRSMTATSVLTYNDMVTNIHYYFLSTIKSVCSKFNTSDVIILWDSNYSYRKLVFPEYKRKVNKLEPNLLKQIEYINSMYNGFRRDMKELGFASCIRRGLEADDLFALYCNQYKDKEIIMVSKDADLYQLLEKKRVVMFDPKKKKQYTEKMLMEEYGLTPKQWITYKQINGCNSDRVPGIPTIGEKTTIKLILNTASEKQKNIVLNNPGILERNLKLVKLPFDVKIIDKDYKHLYNLKLKTTGIKKENFIDLCQKMGFKSFLNNISEWDFLMEKG